MATYSYFKVDINKDLQASAEKFRDLRLNALKLSPTSFSSTYDIESAFSSDVWISRLTRPNLETFVCQATSDSHTEWIATVNVLGPQSIEDFTLPAESGQPSPKPDSEEERWQLLSLFTLPTYRGKGIARVLCQIVLDHLAWSRSHPRNVLVRLIAKPDNVSAIKLYQGVGFADIGRCTLAEAIIANGDRALLPKDYAAREGYNERTGIVMACRIDRDA
jgi:ribosomal protein S18 acetylase RimI-like enzyme